MNCPSCYAYMNPAWVACALCGEFIQQVKVRGDKGCAGSHHQAGQSTRNPPWQSRDGESDSRGSQRSGEKPSAGDTEEAQTPAPCSDSLRSREVVAKDEVGIQAALAEIEAERVAIMAFEGGLSHHEAERQARMQAYDYLLDDGEGWLVMIAEHNDLAQARQAIELTYGRDRVLAVEFHKPRVRQPGAHPSHNVA